MNPKLIALKEEIKRSKAVRLLMKPYMERHFAKADAAYQGTADSQWIASRKDIHKGERCFIVGNGPSLAMEDLDKIKDEYSFATNSIYTCFDRTKWRPTYYLSVDRTALGTEGQFISKLDVPWILVDRIAERYFPEKPSTMKYVNLHMKGFSADKFTTSNIGFSDHPEIRIYGGYTVTYAAMQLALHMGFSEIVLLGIDHSYAREVTSDNKIVIRGHHEDHFYKNDELKGYLYYEGVEYAYNLAKQAAESSGSKILNATRGGNLEIFDRIEFDDIAFR